MALGTYIDLYINFANGHYTTSYFEKSAIIQQAILKISDPSGIALGAAYVPQAVGPMSGRAAHCKAPRNRPHRYVGFGGGEACGIAAWHVVLIAAADLGRRPVAPWCGLLLVCGA